jgi:anti-anti-sigma factor
MLILSQGNYMSDKEKPYYIISLKHKQLRELKYLTLDDIEALLGENFARLNDNEAKVIVDLKELDFIQSSELGILLLLRKKVLSQKGVCILINVCQPVYEALDLAGLLESFNVCADEEEAKALLKKL